MPKGLITAGFACLATLFLCSAVRAQVGQPPAPEVPPIAPVPASAVRTEQADVEQQLEAKYPKIPAAALRRAFGYMEANPTAVKNKNYISIIDFDLPSTEERLFVIDLKSLTMQSFLVAHGKDSGDTYATHFSNEINSDESSIGLYLTTSPYIGEHGLSLHLAGMDPTNSNAEAREIVLHGADYVSDQTIRELGRLGRSLGCPAVGPQYSSALIHQLEGGSILLAHYSGAQH